MFHFSVLEFCIVQYVVISTPNVKTTVKYLTTYPAYTLIYVGSLVCYVGLLNSSIHIHYYFIYADAITLVWNRLHVPAAAVII